MAGIWVQLGHALKEQGDREGGLAAYQTAWTLEPDVADTALQLGHVFKLLNQPDNAIAWYKQAIKVGTGSHDAARELVGLGLDRQAINALRPFPSGAKSPLSQHILWDVTRLWQHRDRRVAPDATAVWHLQIALAALDAGARIEFVVADPTGVQFRTLPPDAIHGLLAGDDVVLGKPSDYVQGAILMVCCPWATSCGTEILRLQTAIMDLGLRLVLFAPDMAPILSPEWFGRTHRDRNRMVLRSLLPLISGVITANHATATQISEWAALGGRSAVPVAALDITPAAASRIATAERSGLTVAMLPRDPAECRAMSTAWLQQTGSTRLHLIGFGADAPVGPGAEAFGGSNVTVGVLGDDAYRNAVATADLLLVPASRSDCDVAIADALRAGCCVMADASAALFDRWGASISYYAPFCNAKALATQWRNAGGKASPIDHPAASWGHAVSHILRDCGQFPSLALPVEVPVGIYHDMTTFGVADASSAWRDGGLLRYGAAWGITTPDGCVHGPAPAILRMRLHDVMTGTYVCRLLHRNPSQAPYTVRVASGSPLQTSLGKATDVVQVPAGKHAWSQISIPAAPDGQSVETLISIEIMNHNGSVDATALPLIAGLFVHPLDQDHLWYEFMDAASRCSFPSLVKLHR